MSLAGFFSGDKGSIIWLDHFKLRHLGLDGPGGGETLPLKLRAIKR